MWSVVLLFLGLTKAVSYVAGSGTTVDEKSVPLVNISVVEGRPAELPCDITPPGEDTLHMVFWFKDEAGVPLYTIDAREKPVTKAQHSSDSGVFGPRAFFRTTFPSPAVLVIDDIKRHDAATYRCRVDFRKGQTRSFRYNLTVIGRQARNLLLGQTSGHHHGTQDASLSDSYNNNHELPRFAEEIQNVTVSVGRDALLACVVENLQKYKVAWVRVDTQTILSIHKNVITQNPRISLSSNDHRSWYLHIKEVQEVDRGWYMCQVNTDPMKSRQGYVQVVVPPSIITKETSTDMVVREASNVTLTCKATGYPEPYVMWRREDGKNINYNGESVNVVDGEVLHIVKISRLHMGAYLCIASNGVPPSVSRRVSLRVQFPPMLSIPNQLEGAYIGQDVTLECHTEAYPNSINYWTTERGDMIVSGDKYEAVSTDSGYNKYMMLKIRNVGPKDFGSYKCVAQNSLGGTDGVIKLDEIPAPSTTSTTQPPYYATPSHKNGKNDNRKSRVRPNDYEVEEWRNPDYDRNYGSASMRPPGELPDAQSPGVIHRAQLVLHLSLSLLSLLLPAIRR